MRLEGKVAIVTGSTKGIGARIARRFAAEGAGVAVCGRSTDLGEEVVAGIREAGGNAIFIPGDVSIESEVIATVRRTVAHFGALHLLVNNAAPVDVISGGHDKPVVEQTADEFDRIMRVALGSTVFACRAAIPEMTKAGNGSIINISSIVSVLGVAGLPAYTCAKGALNAFTRQVAVDYAAAGIRSNCIIVGRVATEPLQEIFARNPEIEAQLRAAQLTRIGTPDDVAEAALYLASDAAGSVTGSFLSVDGGVSCAANFRPVRMTGP